MGMHGSKMVFFWLVMIVFLSGCVREATVARIPPEVGIANLRGFARAREEMVETQIKGRGIKDERLLKAMIKVERHQFVPAPIRHLAYTDRPLPIGEGQTISQPYIVALMTELLKLDGDEKVLEIGTGSGYQAAILAELAKKVYTIEILEPLANASEKLLQSLGYENITVKHGDGFFGWEEHAPFEAIIVTCAPPHIPQPLIDQLAEGGRMVIPVGPEWRWQDLFVVKKMGGEIKKEKVAPVRFVPMTGEGITGTEHVRQPVISKVGTIKYIPLAGGFYGIVTDDGGHFFPLNLREDLKVDGVRVKFKARIKRDIVTIFMWGTPIEIIEITTQLETRPKDDKR